jgi:DNA polymerase III subunit gamma/tau
MSYVVLARKYRPQTFEDVVGQKHVTRTLTSAITSKRIAHAYLFTGTRGVGKTTVARILAKALNCEKGPTVTPCNACRHCQEITKGNSVDVFEIDGASNNSVDDVRELREKVKYLPQSARYKIVIIDEVHMLSGSAFNALLKTLEEPPPHVVFMFATTESGKIPDTILSRVQQYDFKVITLPEIHAFLKRIVEKENLKLDDDRLLLIARKAEGSMRDALSFLDQALSFGGENISMEELIDVLGVIDRRMLLQLSECVLGGKLDETLAILEKLSAVAWDVKMFFGDLLEHFRNLVVARISSRPETMINATKDELEELVRQAKGVSFETLENLFSILVESEEEILRSSYPRLVLEMALVRLATARPVQPLDELALEIGKLRAQLGGHKAPAPPSGGGPKSFERPQPPRGAPAPRPHPEPRRASETQSAPEPRRAESASPPDNGAKGDLPDDLGRYLQALKQHDFALATMMRDAQLSASPKRVSVTVPKGLHYDAALAQKDLLDRTAMEVFGNSAAFYLNAGEPSANNHLKAVREKEAQDGKKYQEMRQAVQQHPTVQMIMEQFPGTELTFRAQHQK